MLTATHIPCFMDRNNSYRESSLSPVSSDSTLCGAAEMTQGDVYEYKEDFLPSIQSRFTNNSGSPLVNFNSSNSRRKNIVDQRKDDGKDLADTDPSSRIYVRNTSDNKLYLLEFKAVDVKLIPIYLKHRTFEENVNDKCNQPYCHSTYFNHYNNRSSKFNQLKKTFEIDTTDTTDRVTIMSHKKPIFNKPVLNDPNPKRTPRISDRQSNLSQSVIYIRYKNMYFEVKPHIMTLSSSEPINLENEMRRKKLLRELHMAIPVDLKNKAKIIVKHKGDVLKFLFNLSNITYSKVKVTTSIAVSAIDDQVYIKDFSSITSRKSYISVPKTQYDYRDPMIDIRRNNMSMKLLKITPLWKEEQRKKRIKEYNQCRKRSVYEDISDLKKGSRICYEGFHSINKAKGKTLTCLTDDTNYENWVISQQKTDLPPIDVEELVKYDSVFPDEVPDWDLVIYTK